MSSDFVTVKEAAEGFGKSDKTIYRLIDRITSGATHSDRHHVKPAPEEFAALKEQRKKIKYIRDNWLSNRVFKSYDDSLDHCCYASNSLIEQPWKIMSIGTRQWAHE